jgi:hypothetical protein
MCLPSNCNLPPLRFIGTGQIEARQQDASPELVVCGFERKPPVGCSGRNLVHHAVLSSGDSLPVLREALGRKDIDVPFMLTEHDWSGATPFYIAMQRGDLECACAIRKVAIEHGIQEGAMLRPNIYGIPPFHALLGLTDQRNSMPRKETSGNVEEVCRRLFAGSSICGRRVSSGDIYSW